jgi:UDP-N-acetylmuramoylalanine--D-glutamate ligase
MAAASATFLSNVTVEDISSGIRSFKGLEHRIEPVGEYDGISWYNDSIATIPEATIEAVKTLKNVDTLILGGYDRGIEYDVLYPFLIISSVSNIIFTGSAGNRMMNEFGSYGSRNINFYVAEDYQQVIEIARKVTKKGTICLLSPAAASYDMFKNFEERGTVYKKNVRSLGPSQTN